jgi:uncharacterized membrane protein
MWRVALLWTAIGIVALLGVLGLMFAWTYAGHYFPAWIVPAALLGWALAAAVAFVRARASRAD